MLAPPIAWFLNAQLDGSPATAYDSHITGKREHHSRSHNSYTVQFASLFTKGGTASLDVGYDLWKPFSPGDTIRLHLRDGRFGWKWVASVERVPGP